MFLVTPDGKEAGELPTDVVAIVDRFAREWACSRGQAIKEALRSLDDRMGGILDLNLNPQN